MDGSAANPVIRTTCPYCGVGCGVLASVQPDGSTQIAGDRAHPANLGRLCVKGSALGETLDLDGRLLQPMRRVAQSPDSLEALSWDEATTEIADRFGRIIAEHGPDSVALYVSGQLLTEDYYVANKFVKGYLGSANIDTNSRLCMSSAVAAHKRAFGADLVPVCYEDLEQTDLIVLVGSNTAWCHPVIYQRIMAAREARPQMKLVVIDPRRTASCEQADLHLPIAPGTDVWLFNGLLAYLHREGRFNLGYLQTHTEGGSEATAAAEASAGDLDNVARICGVARDELLAFYRLWADTDKVITAFSQGVNQSSAGVDKGNAIINCHLATGRIGHTGAGPFSITGQPNAMGGREVGGLANQLAVHLDLAEAGHRDLVQTFWNSPRIADRPGHKAVDLFDAVHDGRVKAVWIIATNPVVSLPNADKVREALDRCEFVVVSDVNRDTDTAAHADLLLPAAAWGEKDGTVTNSERRISRQRAFLPMPGEARPDWWAIAEVARRMGFGEGFAFESAHAVFLEYSRLTAFRNEGETARMLDLTALTTLSSQAYDDLQPVQWPLRTAPQARLFEDGRYDTPNGLARLIPLTPRAPVNAPDADFPMVLNTGRIRDQWHTMTRTGKAPRLSRHIPEPFVEINAGDAGRLGLADGELAQVGTRWGDCVVRVRIDAGTVPGQLFVPIHWNAQTAAKARVGALVNPVVDPISGEPEFKHTPARIERWATRWNAFALRRDVPAPDEGRDWWVKVQADHSLRYELAGQSLPDGGWSEWARQWLGVPEGADWIEASDAARGVFRGAWVENDTLAACIFIAPERDQLPPRDWLSSLFDRRPIDSRERYALLAGRAPGPQVDVGPTVCSCFNVGRNTILDAIRNDGLRTPESLGAKLKCGTNCGSCVPELRGLIAGA